MAITYIKASFALAVTSSEYALLEEACEVAAALSGDDLTGAERATYFAGLSDAFRATFPPTDDPFGGFLAMFEDPKFPSFDCEVWAEPTPVDRAPHDQQQIIVYGAQINVRAVAELIFRVARSALPTGFEYSLDCDILRPGCFGGGYVGITENGVTFADTNTLLHQALQRLDEECESGFVLAIRDPEHGLLFWNTINGFGRLAAATVFSASDAAAFDKPIADNEAQWVSLPTMTARDTRTPPLSHADPERGDDTYSP